MAGQLVVDGLATGGEGPLDFLVGTRKIAVQQPVVQCELDVAGSTEAPVVGQADLFRRSDVQFQGM